MITCTRRLTFCAGHRVMGHENKCAHLHGHNYVVELTAAAQLDGVGRVIDFSVLKARLGGWIDAHWDHGFILHRGDEDARRAVESFAPREGEPQKLYLMADNPTAENMAQYLLLEVCPPLFADTGIAIVRAVVHETENCHATAAL